MRLFSAILRTRRSMADAKTPTRPPPATARRSRRDPREESTPPPAHEEPVDPRPTKREPASRTTRTVAPAPQDPSSQASLDTSAVLAQLAELEAEVVQLRAQNEKDAAVVGRMLA